MPAWLSSINTRLILAIAVVLGCAAWIALQGVQAMQAIVMEEKRVATRHMVEAAHGVVAHYAAQAKSGALTTDQAKRAAILALKDLRYESKEYFWINDMHPRMVMHPVRPELDGQDLTGNKDPSGKPLFIEFVNTVKANKSGFVEYLWPKPGSSTPVPKISFVKGFEEWGWVIGTGIYVDDVQAMVASRTREQAQVLGAMLLTLLIAGWLLRRSIVRPIQQSALLADAIAKGKLDTPVKVRGPSEAKRLLSALGEMQTQLRERIAADHRIRQALDATSVPVRIVDNEGKILFLNSSLRRKLTALEPALKRQISGFDKEQLIGSSIGAFYPNPDEALQRLKSLDSERRSQLEIGGRLFDIVTNPIFDADGGRLGSVGEWVDRHDEIRAERRLAELIEAARGGDLSGRVDPTGLTGFHLTAAQGINGLMEQITKSLDELAQVAEALAHGDLTRQMRGDYQGLFAQLKADMNNSVARLSMTMGDIRQAAESVQNAAQEISDGNNDLSQRTEQQATSLEHTSAKMAELTSTVRQTTDNTQTASRLAKEASALAQAGGITVTKVVTTMSEIGDSSRKVEEIISVINAIAFQTNILALNAAVEAARAGEQGRGFAVVASEVRTLAQRSADAAHEIRDLITKSTERVDAGAKLVQSAGTQMQSIVEAVKRVTEIIASIALEAGRQNAGIEQVSDEVKTMDDMTQQNAALVEQAAAAAESLGEQSSNLASAIGAFRLGPATQTSNKTVALAA